MRVLLLAAFAIGLASCATAPKFQKSEAGGEGYSVREIDGHDHLMVDLNLPGGEPVEFYRNYGRVAVGDECKARGFSFFNVAALATSRYEGFCATTMPKFLGITYKEAGLAQQPIVCEVESVVAKPKSFIIPGDKVLEMDGIKLVNRGDFLRASFLANKAGKSTENLKIERASKVLSVDEPMVSGQQTYFDSYFLEGIRARL